MKTILKNTICLLAFTSVIMATAIGHAAEEEVKSGLKTRVTTLYSILSFKDGRHMDTERRISGFFRNEDDLKRFMILLSYKLGDESVYMGRINEFDILKLEEHTGLGKSEVEVTGDWWLFFHTSFVLEDNWLKVDNEWYLDPPPLQNLPFE
jgi:hypothetical protein